MLHTAFAVGCCGGVLQLTVPGQVERMIRNRNFLQEGDLKCLEPPFRFKRKKSCHPELMWSLLDLE